PRIQEGHVARNVDSPRVGPSAVLRTSEVGNREGTAVHAGENGFGRASASACSDRRWRQFPERVRNGHSRRLPTRRWIGKEAGGCVAGSARHAEAAPAEAWSTLGEVDLRVVGYARRQGIFRVHLHASGRPSEDFYQRRSAVVEASQLGGIENQERDRGQAALQP